MSKPFFVIDTNTFVSANLIENSISAQAFDKEIALGIIAVSEQILDEYTEVLHRKKLDKYLTANQRLKAIQRVKNNSVLFNPVISVSDCRDQKDNMILELALTCNASCIISGDFDLLVLQPFRSIQIVSPSDFVNNYPPTATKV